MLRIGLTGGIGSGKSTVAGLFAQYGFDIIDADQIARIVVAPGQPALEELAEVFGTDIIRADGTLDRAELARRAFDDPAHTELLNSITHPRIETETARRFHDAQQRGVSAIIWDMPLLVDKGHHHNMDLVIVVDVDADERVRRLTQFRGLTEADARSRISAQVADDIRIAAADILIDNNGPVSALDAQVANAVSVINKRLAS